MSYALYGIVDIKGKAIVGTFTSASDETAKRSFLNMLTAPQDNLYNTNPSDFAVYHICDISFASGVKVSAPGMENVRDAGFTCAMFNVDDPLFEGSSLSSEVLLSKRVERKKAYDAIFNNASQASQEVVKTEEVIDEA